MNIEEVTNPAYKKILKQGLDIELRSGREHYDRIYLINEEGERLAQADYLNNRKPTKDVQDFAKAFQGSHKDNAMKEVLRKYEAQEQVQDRWALKPQEQDTTQSKHKATNRLSM